MNKLQGYTVGVLLIFGATFLSCNKEDAEPQAPQCQCYEQHELLETVATGGGVSLVWVIDYETAPIEADCSSATEYTSNGTGSRWKRVCQ